MDRAKQAAFGIWRVIFMLLITYGFTLILMTSAAQQQVAAELSRSHPDLDYSSAYVQVLGLAELKAANDRLEREEATLSVQSVQAVRKAQEDMAIADEAYRDFRAAAPMAKLEASCPSPEVADPSVILAWTRQCAEDAPLSAGERRRLESAWETAQTLPTLYRTSLSSRREAERLAADLATTQTDLTEGRTRARDSADLSGAFDEMNPLSSRWLPGGTALKSFSPLLLQILLALAAGAFGALLLTLILTVYPKNELRFSTGRGFEARIVLGGLISVCVYVVLSGGAAILGTAGTLGDAPANVMTFCAVGILAGMFSDRVAFWLSDRADVFFSRAEPAPSSGE